METLKHGELEKQFPEDKEELKQKFDNLESVTVTINENYHDEVVELMIGRNSLTLTLNQARFLALEIRKAANRIKRETRNKI